jgi:hypothetical protein
LTPLKYANNLSIMPLFKYQICLISIRQNLNCILFDYTIICMLTKQRNKFFKSKASKDLGYNILISFQIHYSLCFHNIYIRWGSWFHYDVHPFDVKFDVNIYFTKL